MKRASKQEHLCYTLKRRCMYAPHLNTYVQLRTWKGKEKMTTYERQLPPHHTEWIVNGEQLRLEQTRSITIEDPGDLAMLKHCLQAIKAEPDKEYTYNRLESWLFLEYKKNKTPQALPSREARLSILRTRPQRQELDLTLDEALALLERISAT